MKVRIALWTAILCAAPSWGDAALLINEGRAGEIHEEVSQLHDAIADHAANDAQVYDLAQNLFGRMPGTKIVVGLNLRGWDREPVPMQPPADVTRLLQSADQRLNSHNGEVPQPMAKAMAYAHSMQQGGRVDFAQQNPLPENEMGVYDYWLDKLELGIIRLNDVLSYLSTKIGDALAFATFIHEAAHARDHQEGKLSDKAVIDGEVLAFQTQYQWLKIADPYDERVCFLRAKLMAEQSEHPSRLGTIALSYLNHLAELQATHGDLQAIRDLTFKLGYHEGAQSRRGDGASA